MFPEFETLEDAESEAVRISFMMKCEGCGVICESSIYQLNLTTGWQDVLSKLKVGFMLQFLEAHSIVSPLCDCEDEFSGEMYIHGNSSHFPL